MLFRSRGGLWQFRHRGRLVAEHPVLAGRAQLSVRPEHGPGAALRNARKRYGGSIQPVDSPAPTRSSVPEVEVRDLAIYDTLFDLVPAALQEAA